MEQAKDDNCVTRTASLLRAGEPMLEDSPFWCHNCKVRQPIARKMVKVRAVSSTRQ